MKHSILLVDDDPSILEGYRRVLGGHFQLYLARGPFQGLEKLEAGPEYAVVVADMRMPGMTGVEFLNRVRERSPESRRIMLSGDAEQSTVVDAVNLGQVSAFLSKPCPSQRLLEAVQAAAADWERQLQARDAQRRSLQGAILALQDLLHAADAGLWLRGRRLRGLLERMLKARGLDLTWQMEAAALLAPMGMLYLSTELRAKMEAGWALEDEEELSLEACLDRGAAVLERLPGFEAVAQAVALQRVPFYRGSDKGSAGAALPLASRSLHLALDLDLYSSSAGWDGALSMLRSRAGRYDAELLQAVLALEAPAAEAPVLAAAAA
jgi:CheY-like chemotaxis protein